MKSKREAVQFKDEDGDILELHNWPTRADFALVDEAVQDDGIGVMAKFKKADLVDAVMKTRQESAKDKEDEESSGKSKAELLEDVPGSVRRLRLRQLCVALTVGGERHTGEKALEAYDNTSPESAEWVDEQVHTIWLTGVVSRRERDSKVPLSSVPGRTPGEAPA